MSEELEDPLRAAWKTPDKKFHISRCLRSYYPFPEEARSKWETPHPVDALVSRLSKKTTLPVPGASSLKDAPDRHLETALKFIYTVAGVILRPALVGFWVNKAVKH